jgi:hypothetical protein
MFKSIVTFIKNTIAKLSAFFGVSKKKFVVALAVTAFFFVFGALTTIMIGIAHSHVIPTANRTEPSPVLKESVA